MRMKRLLALALSAALAVSLLVLPAEAAQSSFSDISDSATAVNADILRLMGVVSGTGGNQFNPGGTLSRAQFCTMAVKFLQRDDEAQRYATRTIFSDVKSTHWARGYVNMAASITVGDGESKLPLVSGVGDGRFLPDSQITLAEAVTILIRALGYSSQQAGAAWPQGYLDLAASIGLTSGLSVSASSAISRAQAAQLFVNALKCEKAGGEVYYKTLGTLADGENKTIILAVNVETDDGSAKGAIRTTSNKSSEAYLPANGDGNPISLVGKRGDLVLDSTGKKIITFIPDSSSAVTITLSGDAEAAYVKAGDGQRYSISAATPVFTAAGGQSQEYSEAFGGLLGGTQVTLYSEKGKIVAVYATSAATELDSGAVVLQGPASAATFHQLTGGVTDFKVVKNRQPVTLSQLRPYDVVTYDQMTNTLVASDLRLSCVYKEAEPNPRTPRSITVLEDEFEVLESAWDACAGFKPGDSVVLLLTADGKVAGMEKAGGSVRSNVVGFVKGASVEIFLPNGTVKALKSTLSSSSSLDGQLVTVSATKSGLTASRLASRSVPGAFQVDGLKLGSLTVSPSVRIYEQVSGGVMAPINRNELYMDSVPASGIAAYHQDSSDLVDYIVLDNVTGNAYEYGMMVGTPVTTDAEYDEDGNVTKPAGSATHWELTRREGTQIPFVSTAGYAGRSGDMVGVVAGKPAGGGDGNTIKAIVQLTEVKGVKPSDFFDSQGVSHVTVNGRTYKVASDVECCRNVSGSRSDSSDWLKQDTGAQRLSAIKAYSNDLTIYVDPVGQQVRIIKANG